jgi:hypothetical protein
VARLLASQRFAQTVHSAANASKTRQPLALTLIFALVLFHDKAFVFKGPNVDGLFACSAYKVYGKIIAEQRYQPAGQRAVLGGASVARQARIVSPCRFQSEFVPTSRMWFTRAEGLIRQSAA